MSGYMDYLSSYYNVAGGINNISAYSLLSRALSGVGSNTGLESLSELSGQNDDNNSFMSVLSTYMGNNILNNSNAVDKVVADRLGNALKAMDEDSEEYAIVKEAYEYLAGKSLGTGVLDSVYRSYASQGTSSNASSGVASATSGTSGSGSANLGVMNPDVLMSSFESEIEEYIENSIEAV